MFFVPLPSFPIQTLIKIVEHKKVREIPQKSAKLKEK
jgi:hypothetical protein